ncbi:hypothetical protein, partial [Shewanella sp. SG44-6]|uniref:hypothetical protein n=1 Tax=Shewanella sp. SG44-6 TaxID=2760959 RepID=UPI001C71B2A1
FISCLYGAGSSLNSSCINRDIAPYRQDIKTLQSNLYSYVKLYSTDEIEVYTPGKRSEVLKLNEGT